MVYSETLSQLQRLNYIYHNIIVYNYCMIYCNVKTSTI
jgi:hypothetical protein